MNEPFPIEEIHRRIADYVQSTEDQGFRQWLGASEIGEKCVRRLWYSFRWCGRELFNDRLLRLFSRGDREESTFTHLLSQAGFIVDSSDSYETDAELERFRFSDLEGHFRGTCDGFALADSEREEDVDWAVTEYKALNDRGFTDLKRRGLKEAYPKYYSQCQTYAGELEKSWTLFCAVNKNDDSLYFEWVPFDQTEFEVCLNKAEVAIGSELPPERYSENRETHTCRYCPFNSICHENQTIPQSYRHCRNCAHGFPAAGGTWECTKNHTFGTLCGDYQSVTERR